MLTDPSSPQATRASAADRPPRPRRAWHAALAPLVALLLAACGGGGGSEPQVPAVIASAPAWGSDVLPTGAVEVTLEAHAAAVAASGANASFVTAADAEARRTRAAAQAAEDLGFLRQRAATDPAVATMLAAAFAPGGTDPQLADGGFEITLEDGGKVRTDPPQVLVSEWADLLRNADRRDNLEERYRRLREALAGDEQDALALPADPAALDLTSLKTALDRLAERVIATVPKSAPPTVLPVDGLGAPAGASGASRTKALLGSPWAGDRSRALAATTCSDAGEATLSPVVDLDFTLKPFLQPARNQGARDTCTGMATTAAIELLAGRQYSRTADLSEQHLWGMYKAFWLPGPGGSQFLVYQQGLKGQLGDGAPPVPMRPEAQWRYNPSASCDGYAGPCSSANHQMPMTASKVGNQFKLSIHNPIDNSAGGERYTLNAYGYISPDDRQAMLNQILAAVTLGQPVGVAYGVTDCLKKAGKSNQPFLHMQSAGCSSDVFSGTHSNVVVGYVTDDELESLYGPANAPPRDGGGYLILRNSWGCTWGDRGYLYVSYLWAMNYLGGGRLFYGISAQYPTATLAVNKAKLVAPGTVTLSVAANALVRKVAFVHGSPGRGMLNAGVDTTAPFSVTVPITDEDRGVNTFIAVGYDENGNAVKTNMVQTTLATPGDPTISLTSPLRVDRNAEYTLTASVFDDSGIASVTLTENGVVKAARLAPPWQFKLARAVAGDYTYTATVTAKDGVKVTSTPRTVSVMPDDPPTVDTFSLTPVSVAVGGGDVTVGWSTTGADVVELLVNGVATRTLAASGTTVVTSPGYECIDIRTVNARDQASKGRCIARVPEITSFTASPATLPPGGGMVTLSWTVAAVPGNYGHIDHIAIVPSVGQIANVGGKAPLSGSVTVNVAQATTFTLTARNGVVASQYGVLESTATASVAITQPDTTPPAVSLAASTTNVTSAQTLTLTAAASDNVGIAKVEFLRGATKIGEDTSAPFSFDIALTAADNGTATFTARAFDAAGNGASASVAVNVNIPVPDTTPPSVSLTASPASLAAPGSTVLSAVATDDVAIARVEFYEGASKIGEALAAPYAFTRSYAASESGSFSYVAVAYDTSGNATSSVARLVNVTAALGADRYVSTSGSDANPGTLAQPYLTLTKALTQVGSGGTVWVAPGTYTWAGEVAAGAPPLDGRTVPMPAGITVRASTPGSTTLNFGLRAGGNATVIGLHLTTVDGDTAYGYGTAFVLPNGGTVSLKGVSFGRWLQAFGYCNGCGGATLEIDANGNAGFNYIGSDHAGVFLDLASGNVAISGGRLAGATLASSGQGCNSGMLMSINGSAQVTLSGVAVELGAVPGGGIASHPVAFCVASKSGATTARLSLVDTTVAQLGANPRYRIVSLAGPGRFSMQGGAMSGPSFGKIGTTGNAVQVTLSGSTLADGTEGIVNNAGEYSEPTVTLAHTVMQGFAANAIHLPHGGAVSVTGGQFSGNGGAGIRLGGVANPGFHSGVYALTLRGATLSGNGGSAGDGAGLVLAGAAGSSFDLGSAAQPGGNTLLGTSAAKPALRVAVDASVTVNAVGNTWTPNQQGASASGTYGGNLVVSSGSGINYVRTSGSLRLAGP